jgi:peptide/nickel transport system substrate-binding protein
MIRSGRKRFGAVVLAIAGVTIIAACSSGSKSSTTPQTGTVKTGGSLTYALDQDVAGFNNLQANDNQFVLAEIMDNVWPEVFVTQPNLTVKLNTDFVTSATQTSTSPQTIVYKINPKAVWSDGTPITAADFIYNWQAQSGDPKYKDVGGKAFLPVGTSGYSQVKSITSSDNGKTATLVFAKPYADWQSLFGVAYGMVPAHIAEKVGFNNGFQTFGPSVQVSGGPYTIQSYTKGQSLVEVRNPKWWGTPGKLSKIIFRFILDDTQAPPAIQNGEANMVNPTLASTTFYDAVKGIPNFTVQVKAGLEFQHLDFNEANPYLAKVAVREAIAAGTDRQQMITRIVAPLGLTEPPLANRVWMPTQPQYQDTSAGAGAFDPAKAKSLLQSAGMTMGSDGYFHPNFGPQKGKDLTFSISTTSGVAVRAQIEELFQASMKSIGIKINIQNYAASTLFGTVGPKSEFDIIEFAWVQSPFASGNQTIYCSYTNTACGQNWDHYANSQVDSLFNQAIGNTNSTQAATLYNQIDTILWKDMVTLPLFQQPQLFGWSSSYGNIVPNTSNQGIPWNANEWGSKA